MRPYLLYFLDTSSLYLSLSSWKGFSLIAGVCAHTLAVLIDCLEIVLYLAIEFSFVNLDLPCNGLQELSFTVSLVSICQRSFATAVCL